MLVLVFAGAMAMGLMLAMAFAWVDEECCIVEVVAAVATGLMLAILGASVGVGLSGHP